MPSPQAPVSDAELRRERESIQRGLFRVNTVAITILFVVIGLAVAAIVQAYRAERGAADAREAARQARDQLWKSYLAQAQAGRYSGRMGRKFESLAALVAASKIRSSPELRNEVVACLALTDVREHGFSRHAATLVYAFDPAFAFYALSEWSGAIRIVRIEDGKEVGRLASLDEPAHRLSFSPDGRLLAAFGLSGTVCVWDWRTAVVQMKVGEVAFGWAGAAMAFDPKNGDFTVGTRNQLLITYDPMTGQERQRLAVDGALTAVQLHPKAPLAAVSMGEVVQIWNLAERRIERRLSATSPVDRLDWNPDGRRLVAAGKSGDLFLFDIGDGEQMTLRGHRSVAMDVRFNHRGDLLFSTSWDGTTRFWDPGSGQQIFRAHFGYALDFSPDDRKLGYYVENTGVGTAEVSGADDLQTLSSVVGQGRSGRGVDFSPDGRMLASAHEDGIRLWHLAEGRCVSLAPLETVWTVAFHPGGGSLFAGAKSGLYQSDVPESRIDGANRFPLGPARRLPLDLTRASGLCFSRDGLSLVVADQTRALIVKLDDLEHPLSVGTTANLDSVALSPDGRWLATADWKGQGTKIWELATRKLKRHLNDRSATVAFSPDGRWLVAGTGDAYLFYEAPEWKEERSIQCRIRGETASPLAFSPDGKAMAMLVDADVIALLSPETIQEITTLQAPGGHRVISCAFNREGTRLAAMTDMEVIQIWDLQHLKESLGRLGLDWEQAGSPAHGARAREPGSGGAGQVESAREASAGLIRFMQRSRVGFAASAGVLLAVLLAALALRRHRHLIRSYQRVDELAENRSQQLQSVQNELLFSERMKGLGTLAAGIAHDFNNLLSVIRMANKSIQREAKGHQAISEDTADVEEAVLQGKAIVRSMLGYSREKCTPGPFSVAEVVDDTVTLLSRQFLSGIELTLEMDRLAPPVIGARTRLEQMLLNLIVNASEAMNGVGKLLICVRPHVLPENATLLLHPRPAQTYVELTVRDSGPGIEPAIVGRIFEPFFTTKTHGATRGTGLGLSMVYTMALQDGLGLQVETNPGAGAAFRIVLPVA